MARAASSIAAEARPSERIYVVGEPAVAHYLRREGRDAETRLAAFDTLVVPVFLVTGRYTNRAPALRARFDSLRPRLQRVASYRIEPNDLRLLDDLRPYRARGYRDRPDSVFDLTLYRVTPPGSRGAEGPRPR
jgi:hypothetical protein